jgi:hypothetical protein
MKEVSIKSAFKKILRYGWMLLLCLPVNLFAQKDSAAATEAKEEESLISPALDFIVVQKSDNTVDLKASVKAKIKGTFIKLPLLKISFFQVTDTTEKNLGFLITDQNGKATLNVRNDALVIAKDGSLHFKASFAGNKQMETADGEVTVKKAQLQITPVKGDSLLTVNVKFVSLGAADSAGKDLTIGIFVKRSYNPLKIGEGTTDENGEVTVEIPANLPGDDKGNITLIAKIDENEAYGNLEASVTQQWGKPVSDKLLEQPRALWSVHPPLWMLITFISLMVIVWGHFLVIVYELFRLRKEEPHPEIAITKP